MGKQMLFITGAVILGTVMLLFGAKQRTVDTQAEQGEYQFDVIARDVAESGFEKALSAVRRDLMSVERSRQDVAMQSGSFDFLMKVVARDMDHFAELCMQEILKFPGVQHVESSFSLKAIKTSHALPVLSPA